VYYLHQVNNQHLKLMRYAAIYYNNLMEHSEQMIQEYFSMLLTPKKN